MPDLRQILFYPRLVLAMTLVHPLEGVTVQGWLRLLRRERFRVDPRFWPRALWVSAFSLANSLAARSVKRRFGAAIAAARVASPVFILGHYRSGTTHLHEVMLADERFASPSRFQAFNPHTFLATERWRGPVVEPFMLPRRVQEDEVAYLVQCGLSPYNEWVFPRSVVGYGRFNTFRDTSPEERAEWSRAIVYFLKELTVRHGKRLLLKSPPHTGRLKLLHELFPDARFIHIRREPYAVYSSTVSMLRAVRPVFGLQKAPAGVDSEAVLRTYREMYDAYFADRAGVPPDQLIEIAYEDLQRDPMSVLRSIYEQLRLGDFESVRPSFEGYLATVAHHHTARHRPLEAGLRARIAREWARSFEEWAYPVEGPT